jgi:ataxia telangiectasia mutated family protein
MTERSVHLISRKPFLALFRHLAALLVHGSSIFDPAALDYAKALRCLLSYPPHLECLTPELWKQLLGICWAAVLGDEISVESEWQDEVDELREHGESGSATPMDIDGAMAGGGSGPSRGRSTISQSTTELVTLIPILLASPGAPILPPFPTSASPLPPPPSLGMSLLLKSHRFLTQYTSETSGHLSILQSLNLVLAEMELNSRNEFVAAGIKLVGPLVGLWGTRSKPLREQVVIALRTILPFITHEMMDQDAHRGVLDAVGKLSDALPKEAALRWGIEPLDLHVLRLRQTAEDSNQPFSLCGVSVSPVIWLKVQAELTLVLGRIRFHPRVRDDMGHPRAVRRGGSFSP